MTPEHPKVRGTEAENLVEAYILQLGYQLVARNLRLGALELDLVARDGSVIVIIEVRTRGAHAWTTGFGSIDSEKRRRIRRAGERLWQRRYRNDESVERLRFDAASVTFGEGAPSIEYVKAAF